MLENGFEEVGCGTCLLLSKAGKREHLIGVARWCLDMQGFEGGWKGC